MGLVEQLDGVRIVKADPERGYVLAWFGGHEIHAYDEEGNEHFYWNVGDFSQNDASEEEVQADMEEEIASGDYLERY